jgi:hypothetical protein
MGWLFASNLQSLPGKGKFGSQLRFVGAGPLGDFVGNCGNPSNG